MKRPKLIVVENNVTFRKRLIFLINVEKSIEIIGEASTGVEFLKLLENDHPDLILIDLDIPHLNGIGIVRKALKKLPCLKIFAFTLFEDDELIIKLIKAGVKGFIFKSSAIYELDKDIHSFMTVEDYCLNNQVINILKSVAINKLHICREHIWVSKNKRKNYTRIDYPVNE
ncbi:MAG: response regulator transcription factor [Paludibacter sp.]|nr:response regulator transcription factor [Paludibacter sp.]